MAETSEMIGQQQAVDVVKAAGGDRVAIYDLENEFGTPIYVHAKACVMDDVWAVVGSDNLNRRSWTHDSELSCAVLDDTVDGRAPVDPAELGDRARRFARDLRLALWREHLGDTWPEATLLDPQAGFDAWRTAARDLARWKTTKPRDRGERPPGRVLVHEPSRVGALAALWATRVHRVVVDPDGRPRDLRRKGEF